MKAFMVFEPGHYDLVDVPVPVPRDDELLLRVGAAGICHSDIDIITGKRRHLIKFPIITGHEFSGTIVDAGKSVSGFNIGDTVVCECIVWCGSCRYCTTGYPAQCDNFSEIGTMRNGAFAEYVAVPSRLAHKFTNLSMEVAATAECAGNASNAVDQSEIMPGDNVVVIGPGPIGLFAVQLAALKHPAMLILAGTRDSRLDAGIRCGASNIVNVNNEDGYKKIMQLTDGRGADVIIQCATSDSAFNLAVNIAGKRSRIAIEGFSNESACMNLNMNQFILKPMTIKGITGAGPKDFENIISLFKQKKISSDAIVSHVLPLEEIKKGMEILKNKEDDVIKIVIKP